MDLLTQLDSEVDLLLKIMSSSIAYVSRKAQHQQLPPLHIPLTILGQTEAIAPAEMHDSAAELVADLVHKAAEIKSIILHLPGRTTDDAQLTTDLHALQTQLHTANAEYRAACTQAAHLHTAISALLTQVSAHQQHVTAWLASTTP